MVRNLRIPWSDGHKISARLDMPPQPRKTSILLAHGAGAGQDHQFMVRFRASLAECGYPTMTFNYAYTEEARKAPDRMPKLLEVHGAAYYRLRTYSDQVVLGGKSMGGRVASHLVADEAMTAAALFYLGYPLVAPGKSEPRSTEHLRRIAAPQLFVVGTRDRLGPHRLIVDVADSVPRGAVHVVDGGDHSLRVPKSGGRDNEVVLRDVARAVADWIADQIGGAT